MDAITILLLFGIFLLASTILGMTLGMAGMALIIEQAGIVGVTGDGDHTIIGDSAMDLIFTDAIHTIRIGGIIHTDTRLPAQHITAVTDLPQVEQVMLHAAIMDVADV